MKLSVGKRAGETILHSERTDGEHRQSVALKTERKVAMRWTHISTPYQKEKSERQKYL